MTEQEFNRYQQAIEIKEKIDKLEHQLECLECDFKYKKYPRSESGWSLYIIINDESLRLSLSSNEFWKCFDLIKNEKEKQLEELKNQFKEL